jgi:hypothetical protein
MTDPVEIGPVCVCWPSVCVCAACVHFFKAYLYLFSRDKYNL